MKCRVVYAAGTCTLAVVCAAVLGVQPKYVRQSATSSAKMLEDIALVISEPGYQKFRGNFGVCTSANSS